MVLWAGNTNWAMPLLSVWPKTSTAPPSRGPEARPLTPASVLDGAGDSRSGTAVAVSVADAESAGASEERDGVSEDESAGVREDVGGSEDSALEELSVCSCSAPAGPWMARVVREPSASGLTVCTSSRFKVPCGSTPGGPASSTCGLMSVLAARIRGSTGLAPSADPTEPGSMVRMPLLTRDTSMVKAVAVATPGPPTLATGPAAALAGTLEKREVRSRLASSVPEDPMLGTVFCGPLVNSLLGVKVAVVVSS